MARADTAPRVLGDAPVIAARPLLDPPPVTEIVTKTYYYAGASLIAMRAEGDGTTGNTLYYLHSDHLGSTSVTTDASGNKVAELRYYPYGQTRYSWNTTPTSHRFTGQISDEDSTGLYFFNARYFDPYLNRWLQPDSDVPASQGPQGLNRYAYVNNSPLNYTDPTGHYICVASTGTGSISQADCETWMEQILKDLGDSGETGEDWVAYFRRLDAQHDDKFAILFQDTIGGGISPPAVPGIILDSKIYLEKVGTDTWYYNVGAVLHEIVHQAQPNGARLTARSEVVAYQEEAKVRNDLFYVQHKGAKPEVFLTDALAVDINDWNQIKKYQDTHMKGKGNPVYDWEPTGGVRRDLSEMTRPIWDAVRNKFYEYFGRYFIR